MQVKILTIQTDDFTGRYFGEVIESGDECENVYHSTDPLPTKNEAHHAAYDWAQKNGHRVNES